jgi:hypothetical protein
MIPRTSSGRGFKGAAAYYLHDKGANTSTRVAFTHTLNLVQDNPRRAIAEMIYTAEHSQQLKEAAGIKATGRKLEKPVYTFSLSWHPSEKPTPQHMKEAGISALKALKMDHHQVLMVAHNDTEHPHIHLVINRIDPETGKAHGLNKDQLILSKWAEAYEKEHGQTWCLDRVKNNAERKKPAQEKGRKFVKDVKGQERDRRPEFDQRGKAIKARAAARAAQRSASLAANFKRHAAGHRANQEALERDAAADAQRHAAEYRANLEALERDAAADAQRNERELYRAGEIEPPDDQKAAQAAFQQQKREEHKRTLFDAWKIAQINTMQDRHNDERRALGKKYGTKRLEAERLIEKQYAEHERQLKVRLAELRDREDHASPLTRWLDTMRGLPEEREAVEKTLANIGQRTTEIRGQLDRLQDVDQTMLATRHDAQKQEQADQFTKLELGGYEIPAPEPAAPERDRGFSRGDDLTR